MFAFACAVTDDELYARCALPGFELAAEPDTEIVAHPADGSIFRSYNMLLNRALERFGPDGLEALILVHQDAEIIDPDFLAKVREALREPDVAIVGCAGALDVRSIAWWEGSVTWASFTHKFDDFGGGEIPALSWVPERIPPYAETGPVDSLDGFVMAFSPWAIENLRFDESIGTALHGYDFDICMQAKEAGKKVVTAPMRVVHHHSLNLISSADEWIAAHMTLTEKWHDSLPVVSEDWRLRARRAEAELAATRLAAGAGRLIWEQRLAQLESYIDALEGSLSWRITAPLRWLSRLFKRGSGGPEGPRPSSGSIPHHDPSPSGSESSASAALTSSRENNGSPR
jgi:hypothetical protein